MDFMSIIGKAAARTELDDAEVEFLRNYHPAPVPSGPPGSDPEELEQLKATCSEAAAERDRLRSELETLQFRRKVEQLACENRFTDREYLEYLCRRDGVNPDEADKVRDYMSELRERMPRFFRCELQAGSPDVGPGTENSGGSGFSPLEEMLSQAPNLD